MSIPVDLSPNSIGAWARDLPITNKGLVGRESYAILQALPKQDLGYKKRLAILEAITPPVDLVLEYLQAQIIGDHPKSEAFLSLALEMCHLLETNYQQLGKDSRTITTSFLRERAASLGMSRELTCLLQQLLFRYLDHQPAPPMTWARLSALGTAVRPKDRAPFFQGIALHLGIIYRLSPLAIRDVFRYLQVLPMERLVKLGKPVTKTGQIGFFIAPGDSPPAYGMIPIDAYPVDLTLLLKELTDGKQASMPAAPIIADLKLHWSENSRTKELRLAPEKPLTTVARFGLSDILGYLAEINSNTNNKDDEAQLYQTVPGGLQRSINRPVATAVEVQIDDISDRGCRIGTRYGDFRSAEIVCIDWHRQEKRIGIIVWFRKTGEHRECGIQWLLNQARATRVRFDAAAVPALVGQSPVSGRDVILYGSQHDKNRGKCWINKRHEWQQHDLVVTTRKEMVEIAEIFPVAPADASSFEQPPAQPPTVHPQPEPATPYQDVWDVLSPSGRGSTR